MVRIADLAATTVETDDDSFYHSGGDSKGKDRARKSSAATEARRNALVIAWDGEGIDLRGPGRPQTYVLFGCSAEPDSPLTISSPEQSLGYLQICRYVCDVGSRYPKSIHIGYGFGYDQNMITQHMPLSWKERLYQGKAVVFYGDKSKRDQYRVKINWKKRIEISRTNARGKTTVRIDDISSFFHAPFVGAYEKIVKRTDTENWRIVTEGKAQRGSNDWTDLPDVQKYWRAEIVALAELGTTFRDLMYGGGFALTDWYGPGALANYMRRIEKLSVHEWGAKESNIPAGLHTAAKSAFYGGRFEQFMLGRIPGPVHSLDINSAYPYAFTHIPSLREGGFWNAVTTPTTDPGTFGVYRLLYCDDPNVSRRGVPRRALLPGPLPYRNSDGIISYPSIVEGWYWRPEAEMLMDLYPDRITIFEGWEWVPSTDEMPWKELMTRMFAARKALKAVGDTTEMAYKLAINSLYGKMAQRVGWNKETKEPPKSHSLAIAGYITSYCRAMIMRVAAQIPQGQLIAIETDGIYTTAEPALLDLPTGIGKELGQWELDSYTQMLYVQSGVYCAQSGQEWVKTKSRGFSSIAVSPESISEYLESLTPLNTWEPLKIAKPVSVFLGIGSALQQARNGKGSINPAKAKVLHCQWILQERELLPGGKGKRVHVRAECPACRNLHNAMEQPHALLSNHGTVPTAFRYLLSKGESESPTWNRVSESYRLPWETDRLEAWRLKAQEEEERIERDVLLFSDVQQL